MGVFWNNKDLQFRICGLMAKQKQVQETKEAFFYRRMEFRGTVVNQKAIGEKWMFEVY